MRRTVLTATVGACVLAPGAPVADAATVRACKPIKNPYAGTRYEGVNITRIRASGTSCRGARRVARGAHQKALGITPPPSGIRRFTWRGWRVTGNLRGDSDRYLATRSGRRIRWVF
jgi:hypothetical protein